MKIERTFLIAPAVVRLMQRERVVSRDIIEGYLSRSTEQLQFVRIEPDGCNLLLASCGDAPRTEERAKVSSAQAKALLGIAQGKIMYRRNLVRIGLGLELSLDRFDGLDLISVQFDDAATAAAFEPPAWFGAEVGEEPSYQRASFALDGMPAARDVPVSNGTVIAFLDALDGNGLAAPPVRIAAVAALEESVAEGQHATVMSVVEDARTVPVVAPRDGLMSEVLAGLSDALAASGSAAAERERDREPLVPFLATRRAKG
jgi:CYTH domain-containing protein